MWRKRYGIGRPHGNEIPLVLLPIVEFGWSSIVGRVSWTQDNQDEEKSWRNRILLEPLPRRLFTSLS